MPLLADHRAIHQSAPLNEEFARHGLMLLAPFRRHLHDPWPHMSRQLSRWRYRIGYRLWPVDQVDASQPPLGS